MTPRFSKSHALATRDTEAPRSDTLARPRPRSTAEHRQAGLDWARATDLRTVERTLDRIALYTWHANRRERLFQIVAERPLESVALTPP